MINIVIPMAGLGSRFSEAGYRDPKPLIPVNGVPMISHVLRNLSTPQPLRFILICRSETIRDYPVLHEIFKGHSHPVDIVEIDTVTEGAACTVLEAAPLIDNDTPCVIANCDQHVDADFTGFYEKSTSADGLIMTFEADHPKWSYVRRNESGEVIEVVEKEVVSNEATVGIYAFKKGSDFCQAARAMIASNLRVNNEFYVAPVYNQLVTAGKKIETFQLAHSASQKMWGLGTPEDLETFHHHHSK